MKSVDKRYFCFLSVLFTVVFLNTCTQNVSLTCPPEGAFVVDEYTFTAMVQAYPNIDSLWCLLAYSFTYHYKNIPGNILSRILHVRDYHWDRLFFNPTGPESPNVSKKWEENIWLRDDMDGVDSIYIEVVFNGVLGAELECVEEFEWTQSTTILVDRD